MKLFNVKKIVLASAIVASSIANATELTVPATLGPSPPAWIVGDSSSIRVYELDLNPPYPSVLLSTNNGVTHIINNGYLNYNGITLNGLTLDQVTNNQRLTGSTGLHIGTTTPTTLDILNNNGLIGSNTPNSSGGVDFAIYNSAGSHLNNLNNNQNGFIGGAGAIYNEGAIGTITNFGTIRSALGGYDTEDIINLGTIDTLINAQNNLKLGGRTRTNNYGGSLPLNYFTYVNSLTDFGKMYVSNVSNADFANMDYGIAEGSTVAANTTYSQVIVKSSGSSFSNTSTKTGIYTSNNGIGYNYSLVYQDTWWNLIIGGKVLPALETQISLNESADRLRNVYNLQSTVATAALDYDCNLFNTKGICLSGGARHSNTQGSTNSAGALLIAAYKVNNNVRIGGYIDQDIRNGSSSRIDVNNNTPTMGVFAAWQETPNTDGWAGHQVPDGQGWGARTSVNYSNKDVKISRPIINDVSEPGSGKADLTSIAFQLEGSYSKLINENVLVTPYMGIRYSKIERDSYTETLSGDVTVPLTYALLRQEQTDALLGIKAVAKLASKINGYAKVGLEQDLHYKGGTYSATGVVGLTDSKFNLDVNRTRPVMSVGATYAIEDNQRLNLNFLAKEESFKSDISYSLMLTYAIGLKN
jgi:hypothetical protein